jgi:hypothetical protein
VFIDFKVKSWDNVADEILSIIRIPSHGTKICVYDYTYVFLGSGKCLLRYNNEANTALAHNKTSKCEVSFLSTPC